MFRLSPLLLISLLCTFNAQALQLGDHREQIVTQYGAPASGDLQADRGMGTYLWNGWRLDIEVVQGTAQRLIFTKDASPISEAEERRLLNDNGGVAAWQPTDHVSVDTMASKKWRRVGDGAEAFTLTNDGRVMCLATGAWAAAWTKTHAPVTQPTRVVQGGSLNANMPISHQREGPPASATSPIPGLMVLAGLMGLAAFAGQALKQTLRKKRRLSSALPSPLWKVSPEPQQLKSACTLSAIPLLPPAKQVQISNQPQPRTLTNLSWQEFELMVGELYRRQGYTVELCSGDGSDGGVDLRLRKDGQTTLVQCKHWKVYKVGVSTVRELFGILAAEQAHHAILVTTGKFTQDAHAFAAGKPLELIEGNKLNALIRKASSVGGDLLDVASWSSAFARSAIIADPTCPLCRSSMVLRTGKQSGNRFWGCSTFPGCRGKRNVRPELMPT